jgi:hypothetical protein
LAVVKQVGEDQGYVDPALDLEAEVPVGEDAAPERTEGCRCRLDARSSEFLTFASGLRERT